MKRIRGLNWAWVLDRSGLIIMVVACGIGSLSVARFFFMPNTDRLWCDAHIYFRATQTWLAGGNPWGNVWNGIPFAAPPPALLLNLPLQPFGEDFATGFWIAANSFSVLFLMRRFRLPFWFVLFLPISEGWLGA